MVSRVRKGAGLSGLQETEVSMPNVTVKKVPLLDHYLLDYYLWDLIDVETSDMGWFS